MKRLLLPVILACCLASCSKDDKNSNNGDPVTGNWRVSFFYDNDKDETSDYTGLTFSFNTNGSIHVSGQGQQATGTWKQFSDDGLPRLEINFNTTNSDLQELNDDWVIESKNNSEIKLSDDNPDRNEQLHFQRQ